MDGDAHVFLRGVQEGVREKYKERVHRVTQTPKPHPVWLSRSFGPMELTNPRGTHESSRKASVHAQDIWSSQ